MSKTFGPFAILVATTLLAGCVSPGDPIKKSSLAARPTVVPHEAQMKRALQQYLDGFNQSNAERLYPLFADDARIEDPVGGGRLVEGKEAITAFYQGAVKFE